MPARTIKINIKLPKGVSANADLVSKATKAANKVVEASVSDFKEAAAMARELSQKGVRITAEEIMARRTGRGGKAAAAPKATVTKPGKRKRVVLSAAQKKAAVADLKKGAKAAEVSRKYGVSHATVMNIKQAAGLTKKRPKKAAAKKVAAKKPAAKKPATKKAAAEKTDAAK